MLAIAHPIPCNTGVSVQGWSNKASTSAGRAGTVISTSRGKSGVCRRIITNLGDDRRVPVLERLKGLGGTGVNGVGVAGARVEGKPQEGKRWAAGGTLSCSIHHCREPAPAPSPSLTPVTVLR